MSDVHHWDPEAGVLVAIHGQMLAQTDEEQEDLGLSKSQQAALRSVLHAGSDKWSELAETASAREVEAWIKALTLAEKRLSGFEVGSKSPVIGLIQHLRQRNELPGGLIPWIRSNTTNRFLPYGSLQHRMRK